MVKPKFRSLEYHQFIGLAAPYGVATTNYPGKWAGEVEEMFARGAFAALHDGSTQILVNHDRANVIVPDVHVNLGGDVGVNLIDKPYLGLVVMFRAARPHAARLRDFIHTGLVRGLSVKYSREAASLTRGRDGRMVVHAIPRLTEISVALGARSPAYADTWLMEANAAAMERLFRESIEAEERAHGNAFIPGKSDLIQSRTSYACTLRRRSA
ncbi:MAG: HK97 family phage prohead protease [Vicinamibacterales bacterium]